MLLTRDICSLVVHQWKPGTEIFESRKDCMSARRKFTRINHAENIAKEVDHSPPNQSVYIGPMDLDAGGNQTKCNVEALPSNLKASSSVHEAHLSTPTHEGEIPPHPASSHDKFGEDIEDYNSTDSEPASVKSDTDYLPKTPAKRRKQSAKTPSQHRSKRQKTKAVEKAALQPSPLSQDQNQQQPCTPKRIPGKASKGQTSSYPASAIATVQHMPVPCLKLHVDPDSLRRIIAGQAEASRVVVGHVTDPELLTLAERMFQASYIPSEEKPLPKGKPPAWADGRQALNEALPYFKTQQGAHHCKDGVVFGVMLDGFSSEHDYLDCEVIICRSGGGLELDTGGKYAASGKSTRDSQLEAVRNCARNSIPFPVIIGQNNRPAQFKIDYRYAVLDFHVATDVWFEKTENGTIVGRYRYVRISSDRPCWYQGADNGSREDRKIAKLGELEPPFSKTCDSCGLAQDQKHVQGWMCLQKECSAFWRFSDGSEPNASELRYDPRFVKKQSQSSRIEPPFDLCPPLHEKITLSKVVGSAATHVSDGIVCPTCQRCHIRKHWDFWQCEHPVCPSYGARIDFKHPFVPANILHYLDREKPIHKAQAPPRHTFSKAGLEIELDETSWHMYRDGYRIDMVRLPTPDEHPAFVAHLVATTVANSRAEIGANTLFEEMQKDGTLGLERRLKPHGMIAGEAHSAYYSRNFGEQYNFSIAHDTTPIEDAPKQVRNARTLLDWAAHVVREEIAAKHGANVLEPFDAFNECLLLGYFENKGISYHDDGEDGVNGTIGTLTLGGSATAQIRVHKRVMTGISASDGFMPFKPMRGAVNWEGRLARWDNDQARLAAATKHKAAPVTPKKRKAKSEGAGGESPAKPLTFTEMKKQIGREIKAENAAWSAAQKVNKAANKTPSKGRNESMNSLGKWHLQHGDMWFMIGSGVQKYMEHTVEHNGGFVQRYSITCRQIEPTTKGGKESDIYPTPPSDDGMSDREAMAEED